MSSLTHAGLSRRAFGAPRVETIFGSLFNRESASRSLETMDVRNVHKNCLIVQFEPASKAPSDKEIFDFFRKRTWAPETLSAMFRAPREHCVYVKFQSEETMKAALLACPPSDVFRYENGDEVNVTFATAKGNYRYVRVFGLPIEVDNKHVLTVLTKYGKVHHLTRERYNPDTGYPILNGVRGIQMEITKDIPAQVFIEHFQARVAYDGMPNRCFVCSASDHVKANCPKRPRVSGQSQPSTSAPSYADALSGKTAAVSIPESRNLEPKPAESDDGIPADPANSTDNGISGELPFASLSDEEAPALVANSPKKRDRTQRKNNDGSDSSETESKLPRPVSLLALQSIRNRLRSGQKK